MGGGASRLLLLGAIQVLRNAVGGGVGGVNLPGKKCYEGIRLNIIRPIPRHVCYSLDSIFCEQLRKLPICNDKHTLVY